MFRLGSWGAESPGTRLEQFCAIRRSTSCTVCMKNSFVGESQAVTLKPCHRLPVVDEKLPDEVLPEADKRKHVSDCPEIYWTTDVAGHKDKAGHLSRPWHLCFHDGEDS